MHEKITAITCSEREMFSCGMVKGMVVVDGVVGGCQCKIGAALEVGIVCVSMRDAAALLLRNTLSDNITAITERNVGNPAVKKCHGLKVNVVKNGKSPLSMGSTRLE